MADFIPAFESMIKNEGGYKLTKIAGDRGGQTYAGIARNAWPNWYGWRDIDAGQIPDTSHVRQFYREQFWDRIRGDEIADQSIARNLFDFAVNAGTSTAIKLAQLVVSVTPDGNIGPKTLQAINEANPDLFCPSYALAKLARYAQIVNRDRSQSKFLLGWVNRVLKEAA